MKFIILTIFLFIFLLIPLAFAETTFFHQDQDNVFIMGDSPTSGITGGTTGGGGCTYKWNCTDWNECLPSGKQTRNCTNLGTCSNTYKSPEIKQNCTYTASLKVEEKDKNGEKENVTGEEEEVPEEQKIEEETSEKEIVNKNKVFIYSIIILVVISIIFYLKKDYFKKLIQKIK